MASKLDFNPFGLHSATGFHTLSGISHTKYKQSQESDIFMQRYLMVSLTLHDGYLGNLNRYLLIKKKSAHKKTALHLILLPQQIKPPQIRFP